jgi:hypothetical protein
VDQFLVLVVHTDNDAHVILCAVGVRGKGRDEGMVTYPRLLMVKLKVMLFTVIQYEGRYQEQRRVHLFDGEKSVSNQ